MSYPESIIREIADRHGLSGPVSLLPKGGMVNEAWAIGEGHVLRIVAEGNDAECDTEAVREAAVVPLLVSAGMRTPALIASDAESGPRPYTIYERVSGELIGFTECAYDHFEDAWRQIGRDLAILHRVEVTDSVKAHLNPDDPAEIEKWVAKTLDKGAITEEQASDVLVTTSWLEEIGGKPSHECLVHNDIHPWNVMGDPVSGELTAVIDWGDATFGDPARDFAMMPLPCVPSMFAGYAEAGGEVDDSLVARAFVIGLNVALWESRTPEMCAFERRWWRMPSGGWPEMKSFVSGTIAPPLTFGSSAPRAWPIYG